MYELVRGPLVWIAFIGFAGGVLYRFIAMALLARKDRVVYPTFEARYSFRSLLHWLVPFASTNMRQRPIMTVITFAFHICLLITPLLLMGHAVLWQESWGVRWWSLPEQVADGMTLVVIFAGGFLMLRRLAAPEVRNVSSLSDFLLMLLVLAPFVTGFIAHQQWLPYRPMLILHIISGALWLLLIPWTRLIHMVWFFITRAYMGCEFGAVRKARDW